MENNKKTGIDMQGGGIDADKSSNYIQEKVKDINARLCALQGVSNIVIWGAGIHTAKLFEKTNILSYSIANIVDIDERKQNEKYFGYIIRNPREISWSGVNAVIISVCGKEKQIMKSLTELGYLGSIVRLYSDEETTPFYLLYDKRISQNIIGGDYDNWTDACNASSGYDDKNIIAKVADSMQKVLSGDAVWERDGCLFYEQKFVYPICAAILRCALQNDNKGVRVLDIGGSLGSTYIQNREYLRYVKNLEYIVAEQKCFAEYGHKNLENQVLKFINSGDDYSNYAGVDIVLLSGSLQYIYPYEKLIDKITEIRPHYIIIDRVMISNRMRICRQVVSKEEIYQASLPITIFSESWINSCFSPEYKLVEKNAASVLEYAYFTDDKADARFYVFERN